VRQPRTGVSSIAQFLLGQLHPLHVDDAEPGQSFIIGAFADIDHQFVIQDVVFGRLSQVMEGETIHRKITVYILTEADSTLLTVHDLEGAVCVLHPVHHVERITFTNGIDDRVAFFVVIDELTLILWSDVELAVVA